MGTPPQPEQELWKSSHTGLGGGDDKMVVVEEWEEEWRREKDNGTRGNSKATTCIAPITSLSPPSSHLLKSNEYLR